MPDLLPEIHTETKTFIPRLKLPAIQFPSNFRFIPENVLLSRKYLRWARIGIMCLLSILFLTLTIRQYASLVKNREHLKQLAIERQKIEKEINDWKIISAKYPDYPDIYLKIAALEYQLGYAQTAKTNIDKALSLNPDMKQGRILGELIVR